MPSLARLSNLHGTDLVVLFAIVAGASSVLAATTIAVLGGRRKRGEGKKTSPLPPPTAYERLIANGTPLIKLEHVSRLLRRSVYVKMESMNPGGTGKDRAALSMIASAEDEGILPPPHYQTDKLISSSAVDHQGSVTNEKSSRNDTAKKEDSLLLDMIRQAMSTRLSRTGGLVVEGTSGSTGIALATLCAARGHACLVVLPDDQAVEKQNLLRTLGATVHVVPTAAISNPNHYVNIARKAALLAKEVLNIPALFGNQFENHANYDIHYHQTGPELWRQCPQIDAFCMSSGTGGTIAGVGNFLKDCNPHCQIVLVDPPGSSLYNKIEHGVAYASQQQERSLRRHRYDTLAEGIGLDRITNNFALGLDSIDKAIRVTDQEAVDMAHWLLSTEGLWVGSSSAMNVVGAIRTAVDLPEQSTIVTVICDGGQRHATRFWNPVFIREWGLKWPGGSEPDEKDRLPECLHAVLFRKEGS